MKNFAKSLIWAVIAAMPFLLTPPAALSGQDGAPLSLTDAVHDAGQVAYEAACASCHLTLMGGSFEAPELAGPNFRAVWCERSLREFRAPVPPRPPTPVASLVPLPLLPFPRTLLLRLFLSHASPVAIEPCE